MTNLVRSLYTALALLTVSGCITTSVVMMDPMKTYPTVANTQLLVKDPVRSYKQIAVLESRGPINTPLPDLLESMRQKGMEIGADAVLPTQDASQDNAPGMMYNPWLGGYQTLPGGRLPVIRGIAVKYE
jgi:hypothetical protein